jgi:hypothetical protein
MSTHPRHRMNRATADQVLRHVRSGRPTSDNLAMLLAAAAGPAADGELAGGLRSGKPISFLSSISNGDAR